MRSLWGATHARRRETLAFRASIVAPMAFHARQRHHDGFSKTEKLHVSKNKTHVRSKTVSSSCSTRPATAAVVVVVITVGPGGNVNRGAGHKPHRYIRTHWRTRTRVAYVVVASAAAATDDSEHGRWQPAALPRWGYRRPGTRFSR